MTNQNAKKIPKCGSNLQIFVKDVSGRKGRKLCPLTVKTWSTINDVKDVLTQYLRVPSSSQSLYYDSPLLTFGGEEVPNHHTLHDAGIYQSGKTLLLDVKSGAQPPSFAIISALNSQDANNVCVSSSFLDVTPRSLRTTVLHA